MLCAEQKFYFNKSESCPFIHLANIVTTNYLPGTAQFTENSKARRRGLYPVRLFCLSGQTVLLVYNQHKCNKCDSRGVHKSYKSRGEDNCFSEAGRCVLSLTSTHPVSGTLVWVEGATFHPMDLGEP